MLKEFDWTERYRLGIPEMDDQHFELVKRVNNLVIAFKSERSKQDIHEILSFLEEYVVIHFNDEEALMEKYGYADLDTHCDSHGQYMEMVGALVQDLNTQAVTPTLMVSVNRLLVEWLSTHIDKEDRAFVESIRR